jgi:hypothetical protein
MHCYNVNLRADLERVGEEMRVPQRLDRLQKRRDAERHEKLRRSVVHMALAEAQTWPQPLEEVAQQEEQFRLKAFGSVLRAEDKYYALRSDPRRRNYDPTPELREQRELDFQRRRLEHRAEREMRQQRIKTVESVRSQLIAVSSEHRLQRAREAASELRQQRTALLAAERSANEARSQRAKQGKAASQPQLTNSAWS